MKQLDMMHVVAIAAKTKNGIIGTSDGSLPFQLADDLYFFYRTTLGGCIIFGRKTFETIGRALPKRTIIVLTKQKEATPLDDIRGHFSSRDFLDKIFYADSIEYALALAYTMRFNEVFIGGGGQVYNDTVSLWKELFLTEVDVVIDDGVKFPNLQMDEWVQFSEQVFPKNERNSNSFVIKRYFRKDVIWAD